MAETAGSDPELIISIDGGPNLSAYLNRFQWRSLINGGYSIYAMFNDPHLAQFQNIANEKYLKDARKKPTVVKWKIKWRVGGGNETEERTAYLTDLDSVTPEGGQTSGFFQFIAIDPPTWYLNWGDAEGKTYKGKVSDVIKKIVNDYAPGISVEVSDTIDNAENKWWMMRQDPKSLIMSLIDWSSSVTNKKTQWIIASVDKKIIIKEQSELPSGSLGDYIINTNSPGAQNVVSWNNLENNYLSNLQTVLGTAGISAVSGLYCDKKNNITKDKVKINDKRTDAKINVNIKEDQSFTKPSEEDRGWTQIMAIPEHSGGELGVKYQDYIDGRARTMFLNMLEGLNRIKLKVIGNHKVHDSSKLGGHTVGLTWIGSDGQPYAGNGKWIIYGFEHTVFPGSWTTDLYLNRLDYDAAAQKR
jgi:hypothetical protein